MNKGARAPRTDGEETRDRILQAAGALFALTGYAETTSKAIAARARVDLASINYHFGSRNGLYQAVLIEAHHQLVDYAKLLDVAEDATLAPSEKLRLLIGLAIRRTEAGPKGWHAQVLARELLSPSSHLDVLFRDVLQPKRVAVLRILSELSGIPQDEPALARCFLSLGAPVLMLVAGRDASGPLQDEFRIPTDEIVDHLHRFAIGGLEAIGRAYRQRR